MKAKILTIKEPWATMIKEGLKTIETRTWKTKYRGKIFLHASKSQKSNISGKIFATAEIIDCRKMNKEDEKAACCEIYPNAHSWFLDKITKIEPIKAKGKLGLWETDLDIFK